MSIGHSSFSSSSIKTSSVSRFLPKSRNDFRLSFSVFLVIIRGASLSPGRVRALGFLNFVGQFRQEFEDVGNNSDVGHLKNRRLGILVDGDDERISLETRQMLERSAHTASQLDLRFHGL